ncbi:MAG: winged helix-turn-helix transcriptional regulator, partial [Ktedonobacteraceae bacterium]
MLRILWPGMARYWANQSVGVDTGCEYTWQPHHTQDIERRDVWKEETRILLEHSRTRRFGKLRRLIPLATQQMLTLQLRELEQM